MPRAARVLLALLLATLLLLAAGRRAEAAAATTVNLVDVSKSLKTGDVDSIFVQLRDGANQTDTGYTGTVTFSASCGSCFTITPNNGGASTKAYTYVAGDAGNKGFSLVWTQAGTFTLTVSATLATGGPATDSEGDIVVSDANATTTTTTAATTTTTTIASTTTTTLATTTTTAAATTTTKALVMAATGSHDGPLAALAVALVFAGLVLTAGKLLGDQNDEWVERL